MVAICHRCSVVETVHVTATRRQDFLWQLVGFTSLQLANTKKHPDIARQSAIANRRHPRCTTETRASTPGPHDSIDDDLCR